MFVVFYLVMEAKNKIMGNYSYIDLHMHSYYSDRTDDPRSLVKSCKLKGIEVMAITDHDILNVFFKH